MGKSLRETLGLGRPRGGAATLPATATPKATAAAPTAANVLPASAPPGPTADTIKFSCGHTRAVVKVANRPCPQCVDDRLAANRLRYKNSAAARRDRTPTHGRLPDGATFDVRYDAAAEAWTGTLTIPAAVATELAGELADKIFTGSASGVFRLLQDLDGRYRAWRREQGQEQGQEQEKSVATVST